MENLKNIIYKKNLNQKQIAFDLNMSPQTFNNYVNGKTDPPISKLIELAEYLHITVDELVGRPTNLINKMVLSERERSIIDKVLKMNTKQQELTEFYIDTLTGGV